MAKHKYTIIWPKGYFITHESHVKLSYQTLGDIIGTDVVEGTQGRWDGKDGVMYVDENACFKKHLLINNKATKAYQDFWFVYHNDYGSKIGHSIDMERVKKTQVKGTVVIKR
jgi:hypothetical protein